MTDPDPAVMERRARSFGAWAAEYDRYRPSYPEALFELIAERLGLGATPRVADLGAGTGKASLAMSRRGWQVTAVEPEPTMVAILRATAAREGLPVAIVETHAEASGLGDASVDLATAAQSYHWFEQPGAVEEMARIVRPGGGVAVFWNVRDDDRSPFLAAYTDLLVRHVPSEHLDRKVPRRGQDTREELRHGGWFDVDARRELEHEWPMDAAEFVGLAFTASYLRVVLDAPAQERFRDGLIELLAVHAPDGRLVVPFQVDVYLGRRNDRPR